MLLPHRTNNNAMRLPHRTNNNEMFLFHICFTLSASGSLTFVSDCLCLRACACVCSAACLPACLHFQMHPDYLVYGEQTLKVGHLYSVRDAGWSERAPRRVSFSMRAEGIGVSTGGGWDPIEVESGRPLLIVMG